jgi:hypothetical protein
MDKTATQINPILSPIGSDVFGLASDNGTLYAADGNNIVSVDSSNGKLGPKVTFGNNLENPFGPVYGAAFHF